jgi:hypothetical protein
MHGLKIDLIDYQLRFADLFEPLFPRMEHLAWFAHNSESTPLIQLMYEPEGRERFAVIDGGPVDPSGDGRLFLPGALPGAANFVANDWVDLIGLQPRVDLLAWAAACSRDDRSPGNHRSYYDILDRDADLCFFCADGWWWECYSHRGNDLQAVLERWQDDRRVKVTRGILNERDAYFPR